MIYEYLSSVCCTKHMHVKSRKGCYLQTCTCTFSQIVCLTCFVVQSVLPLLTPTPLPTSLYPLWQAMAATRWGRDRERMRVEEEEVEEDKFELALYRNSDLFKLCSEHSEGGSPYIHSTHIHTYICKCMLDDSTEPLLSIPVTL